jgi:two-component system chemotaxis sensor kinase CheA
VLSDFVADAEAEFDSLNRLFKSKGEYHVDVLVDMYQSVHAIKSNALILNLDDFSGRLHNLETSIKALQEKCRDVVPVDDFLGLVFELSEAMKEKDQLKATISKIENFRFVSGEEKKQERYVLVETLNQVCQKTQTPLDKKVRLVVEEIDDVVLDYGPRRVIKEVLTQLVRNAVYHGIEEPNERKLAGKDPEGEIRLSIRYRTNQIFIKLTDDGSGIDFERVRQKAEADNLFRSQAEKNDANYLIKAIFSPGFSTISEANFHAGRGIGLSLVKDRVKELRGNIKVSTVHGKGTAFSITIPMELPAEDNARSLSGSAS